MLIAQHKKQTNIAEYILYMWQIEDIIRSNNFDLTQINDTIISKFDVPKETQYDIKLWYQNLIEQMLKEGKSEKGHLSFLVKQLDELNNLHNSLLTTIQDVDYQNAYIAAKENIRNFMVKSTEANSEIEACLIALYGFLMLKLKQSEISSSTKEAMQTFSKLLAILVDRYNKLKKGELLFSSEKSN
ncbi:MAG: DUF4924 family protein [Flavobacteriales bacterium]|nr:DUF4924 family protein [Flavobacteriales bacterium]